MQYLATLEANHLSEIQFAPFNIMGEKKTHLSKKKKLPRNKNKKCFNIYLKERVKEKHLHELNA